MEDIGEKDKIILRDNSILLYYSVQSSVQMGRVHSSVVSGFFFCNMIEKEKVRLSVNE